MAQSAHALCWNESFFYNWKATKGNQAVVGNVTGLNVCDHSADFNLRDGHVATRGNALESRIGKVKLVMFTLHAVASVVRFVTSTHTFFMAWYITRLIV